MCVYCVIAMCTAICVYLSRFVDCVVNRSLYVYCCDENSCIFNY